MADHERPLIVRRHGLTFTGTLHDTAPYDNGGTQSYTRRPLLTEWTDDGIALDVDAWAAQVERHASALYRRASEGEP